MTQVYTPKSIIFLIHDIHFGGGGEQVTINLANHFEEKGYIVKIISLSQRKTSNIYSINRSIGIDYLDINFCSGSNTINKIISIIKVNKYFYKHKDKSIILGIGNYPSILLCFLPKRKIIKTVGCQHLAYSGITGIWALLRKVLFKRLDRIVSLTIRDLSKYQKLNNNSVVIPNSISLNPNHTALLTNKQILFIGRMVYEKGYDFLIDVIRKINAIQSDWDFKIIGAGPLKKRILKEIELSGLKEKISLLPSTKFILEEYLNASIFLMTSRTEGLPMVLLEAQACGLPIVSFDCETGPSDIVINNENGFLIDCYNIETMVLRISQLCSDYELRVKFGKSAIENIKKFSPEIINSKWEILFKELFQK